MDEQRKAAQERLAKLCGFSVTSDEPDIRLVVAAAIRCGLLDVARSNKASQDMKKKILAKYNGGIASSLEEAGADIAKMDAATKTCRDTRDRWDEIVADAKMAGFDIGASMKDLIKKADVEQEPPKPEEVEEAPQDPETAETAS